jgi:hypothetical protein
MSPTKIKKQRQKERSRVSKPKEESMAVQVMPEVTHTMPALDHEAMQAMFMAKVKETVEEVIGPQAPSERITREAEIFARETRSMILTAVEGAYQDANEKLNQAATKRAHAFKALTKKVATAQIAALLEEAKDKRMFMGSVEDRAFVTEAIRDVVKGLCPEDLGHISRLPGPSTITPDPLWDASLSPGVTDFLAVWKRHGPRSCIVTGPSGCGKTHPIRQWARGLGLQVWIIQGGEGCATRREAVGGYTLNQREGASVMERQVGIAASAAIQGGLLLIDEYDKIDPFVLGQLNDLIDNGGLMMPWGEFIVPHQDFRVAMTGNGLSDDSGAYVTHQTSSELPMRCWGCHAHWPNQETEAQWLVKAGADETTAARVASTSSAIRATSVRPAPSLRTSLFVINALKAMSWKDAWVSSYLYQFNKDAAKEAADVIGTAEGKKKKA